MPDPDEYSGVWLCQVERVQKKMVFVREEDGGEICNVATTYAELMDPDEWDTTELECTGQQELTHRELRQLDKHPDQPEVVEREHRKGEM